MSQITKILIVDKNMLVLSQLQEILSEIIDLKILTANSCNHALSILKEEIIDLLLIDSGQNEMDGFKTAIQIKNMPDYSNLPLVFMTSGKPDTKFQKKIQEFGSVDFITKPIRKNEIISRLNIYLSFIKREKEIQMNFNDILEKFRQYLFIRGWTKKDSQSEKPDIMESGKLISEFLSNLGHEIRTYLNPIIGFSNLISNVEPKENRKEFINIINENCNQLFSLIDEINEAPTHESGKVILSDKTILIVEDIEDNYWLLKRYLDYESLKILWAKNGEEAVNICTNEDNINFVLMDLRMPVMDGFEATKKIKKIRPFLPIIAQSAYDNPKDKKDAKTAGCDDFLAKPLDRMELFKKINFWMSQKSSPIFEG